MKMRSGEYPFQEGASERTQVKVTVLYEDLSAGLRAKALMQSVASKLSVPATIMLECWRFDWLSERSLGSCALGAASKSAILLFSLSLPNELPPQVLAWLDRWVQTERGPAAALVILLAPGNRRSARCRKMLAPLQRAAQSKGADFFCEYLEPQPAGNNTLALPASLRAVADDLPDRSQTLRPEFGALPSRRIV